MIALALPAMAQDEPHAASAAEPVLRALPLGGNDALESQPVLEVPAPETPRAALPVSEDELKAAEAAPTPTTSVSPEATDDPGTAVVPPEKTKPERVIPNAPPTIPLVPDAAVVRSPVGVKPEGDDAVRLQIFLDQAKFGPGVIDGRPGRFTELAVVSWNEVHGHPSSDWTAINTAVRLAVPNPFATAIVPQFAKEWVDSSLPTSRTAQAKRKKMSYRSYAEYMSERYHTDVPYLMKLNGAKKTYGLKPGDSLIVPNVAPFKTEALFETKFEKAEKLSDRHVVINTKNNQVRIYEATPGALVVEDPDAPAGTVKPRANRSLIASFPITPGKPKFIKLGTWELKNMVVLPWWRFDKSLLETGKRSKNALMIPAGPNSPVGVIWNGTSRAGIGMHGTSDPETIGRARSAGCIRLANWDAIRLPEIIRPGATVEIR
ncbi:MAG: L,D-transpeptidase family protein [Verrucomicrobiota bacterium]